MSVATWGPYAAATLALLGLIALPRLRPRHTAQLTEFLVLRGAVLALMALVLALLTDAAAEGDGLTVIDRPIWSALIAQRTPLRTAVATVASDVGSTGVMAVIAGAAVVVLFLRRRRAEAVLVLVVTAGAGLIVLIAKPIVGRVRPPAEFRLVVESNQSFPSGHAVASAAVLGVLAAVFAPLLHRRWQQLLVRVLAVVAVLTIGLSRLYLGVHWATDVVGGALAGTGWLLLCLTGYAWWCSRPARSEIRVGRRIAPSLGRWSPPAAF